MRRLGNGAPLLGLHFLLTSSSLHSNSSSRLLVPESKEPLHASKQSQTSAAIFEEREVIICIHIYILYIAHIYHSTIEISYSCLRLLLKRERSFRVHKNDPRNPYESKGGEPAGSAQKRLRHTFLLASHGYTFGPESILGNCHWAWLLTSTGRGFPVLSAKHPS